MKKFKRILLTLCIAFAAVIICSSVYAFNEYWKGNGVSTPAPDKRISVGVNDNYWDTFPAPNQRIALAINDHLLWSGVPVAQKRIAIGINDHTLWSGVPVATERIAISINDRQTWNKPPFPDKRIAVAINDHDLWKGGAGTAFPDVRIAIAINGEVDLEKLKGAIAIALTEALADVSEKSKSSKTNQKTNTQLWDDLLK